MKRYLRSSKVVEASVDQTYTDRFNFRRGNQKFSIYTKYADDPEKFQCQITEIHPYDLAEYYWIKKDQPAIAKVIDPRGRVAGYIEVREYDEDDYEDSNEYINDILDYMCTELRGYNKNIKPVIDRT